MTIDHRLPVPLYHQLENVLREQIVSGAIAPGSRLPSEPELSRQWGISRATARQALTRLASSGFAVRRRGEGTFASRPKTLLGNRLQGFTEEMRAQGLTPGARTLRQELITADAHLAAALEAPADARLIALTRLRLINEQPVALSDVFIPAERCPGLEREDLEQQSLYHVLEKKYRVTLHHAEKEVEAVPAPGDIARILKIRARVPLLHVIKRTFDDRGLPVEYQTAYWRGDRYRFRVTEQR